MVGKWVATIVIVSILIFILYLLTTGIDASGRGPLRKFSGRERS